MLGIHRHGFFRGGRDQSASGEMVRFSEQAARSLVNGSCCRFVEKIGFDTGNFQVMPDVFSRRLPISAFKVASRHDS